VITSRPLDQTVTLRHIDTSASGMADLEIALQGVSDLPGDTPDHSVRVLLNGSDIGSLTFDGQGHKVQRLSVSRELLKEGDNVVTFTTDGRGGDVSLVDYIRVTYPHTYAGDQDSLLMTAAQQAQVIEGFSDSSIRVFDITDASAVQEISGTIDRRSTGWSVAIDVQGSGTRTLLALTDSKVKKPAAIALNEPSSLATKKNKADLVIISRREFFPALEPLKALRESQKLKVALVDIEDIFDEFNNGEKSPQAVKDFLSFATTTWKKKPRFVIFAGHASLDPRNYLGFGDSDIVPTKLIDTELMESASDDWFVDFDNDGLPEIATGRLPFRNVSEAATIVSKITAYESSTPSSEALLVSDVGDTFDFEAASGKVRDILPASLRLNQLKRAQVDLDLAKRSLMDALNRGPKIVNYIGHGSVNLWRGDLLTNEDAPTMTNSDHLSVFVMMTCLNGYFQDSALDSLGESLLKAQHGGAVAVWASTTMTLPEDQAAMNQQFYRLLFSSGQPLTIGEAVLRAKSSATSADVRRTWALLGDPTMRLK
jgi:peptidase C25-like protein